MVSITSKAAPTVVEFHRWMKDEVLNDKKKRFPNDDMTLISDDPTFHNDAGDVLKDLCEEKGVFWERLPSCTSEYIPPLDLGLNFST